MDFLLTAKRDLDAAKRFFRKMLQDQPLLGPHKIGTDGANVYPSAIADASNAGLRRAASRIACRNIYSKGLRATIST